MAAEQGLLVWHKHGATLQQRRWPCPCPFALWVSCPHVMVASLQGVDDAVPYMCFQKSEYLSVCYISVVTPGLPRRLHPPPPCNLRASKLLIVLPHINSKSLIFMSHPTLPLDRILALCYLFPLPLAFRCLFTHQWGCCFLKCSQW